MSRSINKIIEKPMSNFDINKYLPSTKIITTVELQKYNNIDDLFHTDVDSIVILFVDCLEMNNGHWCCLSRYISDDNNGIIEFFDSYGNTPEKVYLFCDKNVRNNLGIDINYLNSLVNKSNYYFICNTVKYQKDHERHLNINTCGRHVTYRIMQLLYKKKVLPVYNDYMKYAKKYFKNKSYDEIVSILINM